MKYSPYPEMRFHTAWATINSWQIAVRNFTMMAVTALAIFAMTGPAAAGYGRNAWLPGPGYYWQCNSGVASYLQWNDQPATCVSDVYGKYTDYGVWRCASPWWLSAYSWRCQ